MSRRLKMMGRRQRDILDTLRAGPMSTVEIQAELGACNRSPLSRALRLLHLAGLVSRSGTPTNGFTWRLTAAGEVELQLRERAGYAPGVSWSREERISAALDAPYRPRKRHPLAGG